VESEKISPGNELVVVDHEIGRIGLTICYDLRFPNQFQKLRDLGSEIIFVPSAFTVPTGEAHWITLIQARAIENQTYICAPAQYGRHTEKRISYGSSVVVDGWGRIISKAENKETLIYADIDLSALRTIRKNMPVFSHRVQGVDV